MKFSCTPRFIPEFFRLIKATVIASLIATAALPVVVNADDVVYSDSTFPTSDWGFQIAGTGTGSSTPSQVLTGGNPGSCRQISQNVAAGSGLLYAFSRYGVTFTQGVWSGPIASVDFSIDAKSVSVIGGQQPLLSIGIKQSRLVFVRTSLFTVSSGGWNTYSETGLIPTDFVCINSGAGELPDFSDVGGNIRFGFVNINGSFTQIATGGVTQYDNFKVTIHPAPPPCFGDLDGSGEVDAGDVGLTLLDFGPCIGCPTDLDGSSEVDSADLGLVLLSFGPCT